MSAEDLSKISGLTSANDIQIKVRDVSQVQQTVKNLDAFLRAQQVTVLAATLVESDDNPSLIDGLFTVTRVLAAIALLLTSFLIINTMTTLVAEQTKIIGTMNALGGSRWAIIRTYLLSVTCYGLLGTIIGIALGIWGGYQFTRFLANVVILDLGPFSLSPGIVATSVVVGVGFHCWLPSCRSGRAQA